MSELEDEINRISWATAVKMQIEQSGRLLGLVGYEKGEPIDIDLTAETIDGFTSGPDQHISGRLVDPQNGIMHVFEATEQKDWVGAQIGLGTYAEIMTPAFSVVAKDLKACVAAGRSMAYFFANDIDPDSQYKMPRTFHHMTAKYRKVVIGSTVLFGEDYSPPQP